jgi:ATP-dependent Clp protease ATP-binding subunit ClpA
MVLLLGGAWGQFIIYLTFFFSRAAIDLVDEAAAKLKMEITSKPIELDEVDRDIIRFEMEKLSLKNDTDKASKERLSKLEAELESLKEKQKNLSEQWEYEKSLMTRIKSVKEEVGPSIFCSCVSSGATFMIFNLFIFHLW